MDHQLKLFNIPDNEKPITKDNPQGKPRLKCTNRQQMQMNFYAIDQLISDDHIVRVIWKIVDQLDLSPYLDKIGSTEGKAGRPPTDPKILLCLWIYATIEGIGSARTLDRYCKEHLAFIWICGGVSVNYHTLSDFRNQTDQLEKLFTQIIASLIYQGIISTEKWAHDGMRVRANAGSSSFRREKALNQCHETAKARIKQLKEELNSNPGAFSFREKAAKERAAKEQLEKANAALKTMKKVKSEIDSRKNRSKKEKEELKKNARVSTTDSEARKMKMPNGGFDPAYNVQYASDAKSRFITLVDVTNNGSDAGQMLPMIKKSENLYSITPEIWLVDAGFCKIEDLIKAKDFGTEIYMPIPEHMKRKKMNKKEGFPLLANSDILKRWYEKMETEEGKKVYRERASVAEYSNASTRNKGFYQFMVRGLEKVKATSFLFALTHNIERLVSLMKEEIRIQFKIPCGA